MSKTSHTRHENKEHTQNDAMKELEAMEQNTFAHQHKTLIWLVIIGLFIMLPIVFGALALLRII